MPSLGAISCSRLLYLDVSRLFELHIVNKSQELILSLKMINITKQINK